MDAMTSWKSESVCTGTFNFFSLGVEQEVHLSVHCFEIGLFSFSLRKNGSILFIVLEYLKNVHPVCTLIFVLGLECCF